MRDGGSESGALEDEIVVTLEIRLFAVDHSLLTFVLLSGARQLNVDVFCSLSLCEGMLICCPLTVPCFVFGFVRYA